MLGATALIVLVAALGACGDGSAGRDAGGRDAASSGDGGGAGSCAPDRECPTAIPSVGGPCEGSLDCDYTEPNDNAWRYSCAGGGWSAENTYCGHDGICVPPLVESCSDPSADPLAGATVEVGAARGAFAPFRAGDAVPMVIGLQGGTMLQVRVRVTAADPPSCAVVESTMTTNGMPGAMVSQPVALHCGLSQPIFLIMPVACGEAPEHDVALQIGVVGAGETDANLRVTGGDGPCPG